MFQSELSSGSLDDMIYTLNIPLVVMDKLVSTKVPGDLGKSLLQPILEGLLDKHNEKLRESFLLVLIEIELNVLTSRIVRFLLPAPGTSPALTRSRG